jgi:protein SOK2
MANHRASTAMTSHTVTPHGYVTGSSPSSQQSAIFDSTGQVAPPGAKPRVTATLWEDEGSLCYQVEAKGVCVARREGTSISGHNLDNLRSRGLTLTGMQITI